MGDDYIAEVAADLAAQGIEGDDLIEILAEVAGVDEEAARTAVEDLRIRWEERFMYSAAAGTALAP